VILGTFEAVIVQNWPAARFEELKRRLPAIGR
jgi:hypothetical protein